MQPLIDLLNDSFLQHGALWALNNIPGFPPIIQTVHILGIAVVMGTAVLISLRLLRLALPSHTLDMLISRCRPWFWCALASNVISGSFFVFGRPARYFNNPVFLWKLAFLVPVVLITAFLFHQQKRHPGYWDELERRTLGTALAIISLLLWIMVCTAGRWIAYLEYIEYPLWSMEAFDAGPQVTLWLTIENWPLSQVIAATNWFPLIETVHVIAISLVVGSILWVDLRLLGLTAMQHSVRVLNKELIPWTWGAFAVSLITGLGMFITRASSHVGNPAMQWKMGLMALAGLNMAYFHFRVYRNVDDWDSTPTTPRQLKIIGATSLLLWSGVTLGGRWIGHIV